VFRIPVSVTNSKLIALTSLAAIVFVAAACGDSSDGTSMDVDREPILALAGAATEEAQNMERHADEMEAAAATRPDHAHWAADAATLRANASSVAFMANAAMAIYNDPGSHGGSGELDRVFSDGVGLHELGETLAEHADAMQSHVAVMREQAAGDQALLTVIDSLASDADAMKTVGEAAMDRGTELQNQARRLANTVGIKLPSGGEHEDR